MSRALLKAQLEMVSEIEPGAKPRAEDGQTRARRKKHKRDKEQRPAAKTISRAAKRASMHQLDRLRKELEVKDHTQDNITDLNRRGDAKHRSTADRQARKLAAMLTAKKRKRQRQDDDSGDDEKSVDMWKVLRQMKARGL